MATRQRDGAQATIGTRLRAIRRELGATLAEVSARTGASISALSKIENAQISPSYDILKRICDGLGIGIEDLVSSADKISVAGQRTVTRINEGARFASDQYEYRAHAPDLSRKGMVPLELTIHARSVDEFDHWSCHRGEEFVYVLAGLIEVHSDGHPPYRLNVGESAYFDSSIRHLFLSVGPEDARVLSVSHDPGAQRDPDSIAGFMNPAAREVDDGLNGPIFPLGK
jgi:transcriptional regulator with XRE-family HTH domain